MSHIGVTLGGVRCELHSEPHLHEKVRVLWVRLYDDQRPRVALQELGADLCGHKQPHLRQLNSIIPPSENKNIFQLLSNFLAHLFRKIISQTSTIELSQVRQFVSRRAYTVELGVLDVGDRMFAC